MAIQWKFIGTSWDLCAMDLRQVNIHGSPVRHCAMLRQAEIEALFEMRQLMEQQEFLERRQDDSGEGDVPWSFNVLKKHNKKVHVFNGIIFNLQLMFLPKKKNQILFLWNSMMGLPPPGVCFGPVGTD